jgi:hypothetical protein
LPQQGPVSQPQLQPHFGSSQQQLRSVEDKMALVIAVLLPGVTYP